MLRLSVLASTRSQRSNTLANGPPLTRAATIACAAASPTPLTDPRPYRIAEPSAAKSCSDRDTSGGSTLIPIRRHSSMYSESLSRSPDSHVSSAAMNACGSRHFMYAVWYVTTA